MPVEIHPLEETTREDQEPARLLVGLMFVAVGMGFAWGATVYSFGSSARPGPATFPSVWASSWPCWARLVLFKALTIEARRRRPHRPLALEADGADPGRRGPVRL
jgi:hypothetical protein